MSTDALTCSPCFSASRYDDRRRVPVLNSRLLRRASPESEMLPRRLWLPTKAINELRRKLLPPKMLLRRRPYSSTSPPNAAVGDDSEKGLAVEAWSMFPFSPSRRNLPCLYSKLDFCKMSLRTKTSTCLRTGACLTLRSNTFAAPSLYILCISHSCLSAWTRSRPLLSSMYCAATFPFP